MTTLAFYSNKGGVGKTAAAVNISYLAAQSGTKTLIWDLDPQSSTTYYFRVKPKLKQGIKGFIQGEKQVYQRIKGTDYENLDLLPADFSLRKLDIYFNKMKRSTRGLKRILDTLKRDYDLIILDCPVTITLLAENIINASDTIFVPVIPTTLSLRTYRQLLSFCRKKKYNIKNIHIFFSMVDRRKKMHTEFLNLAKLEFQPVLNCSIPYLSEIERMGIAREPVVASSPKSIASQSYQNLWLGIQKVLREPLID
jgi:cellulose biosynthesis protein BcsQ